jgi:hypothetical protein
MAGTGVLAGTGLRTALGGPRGAAGVVEFPCSAMRLANGNTLIADAGDEIGAGSEVLEVDPAGQIVWRYGEGLRFAHSAERLPNGNTLIADTTNDRVIEVSPAGALVFSTDDLGPLSDGSRLEYPNCARQTPDGRLLITDRNNNRCLLMDRAGRVAWQYGGAKHPHNAEMLPNGHVLLADSDANRIVEVSPGREVVWAYGDGSPAMLSWPRHARRLANGNTLITDSKNARVLEVTPAGETAWCYRVPYLAKFYWAEETPAGHVLIGDQQGHRAFEVDRAGNVLWMYRSYIYPNPIHPTLQNGGFAAREDCGWPQDWILVTRLSEGGGEVVWEEGERPAPGLAYDRNGALLLQQTVQARAGARYRLSGWLRAERLDGFAFFQLAFVDAHGAAIHDGPDIPRGEIIAGTQPWTRDAVEAVAPAQATALEVRLFISGRGRAFLRDLHLEG